MKTAIVTGAAGDIGIANCRALLEAGYQVAAVDRDTDGLARLENMPDASGAIKGFAADILSMDSVEAMYDAVRSHFGPAAVLVNGAGGITAPSLRQCNEEDWIKDVDLNLNGPWRCQKVVLDDMIAAGQGVVINIASVNGLGVYGYPGYSAAKAGLIQLTKFTAVEFARFGIRCNAIAPGSVMTAAWEERRARNPDLLDRLKRWYPQRAFCTPDEIAALVGLLASDSVPHLTGQVLCLDGGLSTGQDAIVADFIGEEF